MLTLSEFVDRAHTLWPLDGAESWDAPGLTAGLGSWPVRRVLVAVDAVDATVAEAVAGECDVLLTHHPLIMRGITSVSGERYKGELLTRLIQANCALLSAHTNADVVADGATGVLAELLGLRELEVIEPTAANGDGIGRVGNLAQPSTLGEIARRLAQVLPATAGGVRASGDWAQPIQRIALCSGAGDSLLAHPLVQSADLYVTGDLRHHPAQEAREQTRLSGGPALIDVSHWASEWLWAERAAAQLARLCPDVEVVVSELNTDPWNFVVFPAERPE